MEEQSQQTTTIFDNKTEQQLQEEQKLNHSLESRQGWYKAGFFVLLLILIFSLTGNAYLYYYMNQMDTNAEKGMVKQPNNGLVPPQDGAPAQGSTEVSPTISPTATGTTFTGETKEFISQAYGFRMLYPAAWEVMEGTSQIFEQGDVVMVRIVGETQSEGTEFYDGGYVAVGKPLETEKSAEEWVRERYKDSVDPSRPAEFSKETIGATTYEKAYVCGQGCFQYYHTKKGTMLYSFVEFAEGPEDKKPLYQQQVRSIVESFQLISQ